MTLLPILFASSISAIAPSPSPSAVYHTAPDKAAVMQALDEADFEQAKREAQKYGERMAKRRQAHPPTPVSSMSIVGDTFISTQIRGLSCKVRSPNRQFSIVYLCRFEIARVSPLANSRQPDWRSRSLLLGYADNGWWKVLKDGSPSVK